MSSRAAWSMFPKDAGEWTLAKACWQRAGCQRKVQRSRRRKTSALNRIHPHRHLRIRQSLICRRSVPCCRRVGRAALPPMRRSLKACGPGRSESFGSQSSIRRRRKLNWSSRKSGYLRFQDRFHRSLTAPNGAFNADRNLVVLRDDQIVAMLDKIQRKIALYQIGGPRLGAPRERGAIVLTLLTVCHPQLV